MSTRRLRMAVGIVASGLDIRTQAGRYGLAAGTVRPLVREAIERCGFAPTNEDRFNGTTIHGPTRGVYLIEAVGINAVKIGWSDNVRKRYAIVSLGLPVETRLIDVVIGATMSDERQFHHAMRHWRLRGEWFAWNSESKAEILEFANSLKKSLAKQ